MSYYQSRANRFYNFLRESAQYFGFQNPVITINIKEGVSGAGINLSDSRKNRIFILYGLETRDDINLDIKLAWHEMAHWKDALDGWPIFTAGRLREHTINIHKLDESFIDNIFEGIEWASNVSDTMDIFFALGNVISDVSVCRRIMKTPAYRETLLSMIGLLKNVDNAELDLGYACRRIISIAMEMEYTKTSKKNVRNNVKRLKEIEVNQLRIFYDEYPVLREVFKKHKHSF